jgi:riboflavin kinase / FMN adenylyltransferase
MADRPEGRPRPFAVVRAAEPGPLAGAVVALGNLDGVHLGHQALIAEAKRLAAMRGGPAAALTFEPHPRTFFNRAAPVFRLSPEPSKLALLRCFGLDGAIVLPFDQALAALSPEAFVDELLVRRLRLGGLTVGQGFRFGKGREGSPERLRELGSAHGLTCTIVADITADGAAVSSTAVRERLEAGDVEGAERLLGYRWFVAGEVRHGEKRGRQLGFPTANLRLGDDCRLRHGIYAVRASLPEGRIADGVASFGRRPTFDNGAPLLETYLFDSVGDLYGQALQVEFVAWIRGEERFDSVDALVGRMRLDSAKARARLVQPMATRSLIGVASEELVER